MFSPVTLFDNDIPLHLAGRIQYKSHRKMSTGTSRG